MTKLGFYEEYISRLGNLKDNPDLSTAYKIDYLKSIISDNKVYKFISLEKDADIKMNTFMDGKIWFSFYRILNDETEFKVDYKVKKVIKETGYSKSYISHIVHCLTELYDVYSLTYEYQDNMWSDYASNGNGICIEYDVGDYDYLFPVEYCDKSKLNFTKMVIHALKNKSYELSIIPWVIKNPYNETADMDSRKEKEVRILYCPFDLSEVNNGTLEHNIKEKIGYKGIAKPYSDFALSISKVIIGDRCEVTRVERLIDFLEENKISYEIKSKE